MRRVRYVREKPTAFQRAPLAWRAELAMKGGAICNAVYCWRAEGHPGYHARLFHHKGDLYIARTNGDRRLVLWR